MNKTPDVIDTSNPSSDIFPSSCITCSSPMSSRTRIPNGYLLLDNYTTLCYKAYYNGITTMEKYYGMARKIGNLARFMLLIADEKSAFVQISLHPSLRKPLVNNHLHMPRYLVNSAFFCDFLLKLCIYAESLANPALDSYRKSARSHLSHDSSRLLTAAFPKSFYSNLKRISSNETQSPKDLANHCNPAENETCEMSDGTTSEGNPSLKLSDISSLTKSFSDIQSSNGVDDRGN